MSKALLLNFGQKILQATTRSIPKVENKLLEVQTKLGRRALGNPSQITNEFKPIMPTELKTIKQMAKFNKTAFGVKVFDVPDKEFGKFLTEGLTGFYNRTGGQFKIAKNIIVCDLPNPKGFMMYEPTKDILAISKKHVEKFQEIARENGETLEQVLSRWGKRNFDGTATSIYKRGIHQELFHELGHKAHSTSCKNYNNLGLDWSQKEFQEIAAKVSQYSKESPEEFVAETFSLLVQGKKLPQDVLQLYEKCGGPIINSSGGSGGGLRHIINDFMVQDGSTGVSFADLMSQTKKVPNVPTAQVKMLENGDIVLMNNISSSTAGKIAIEA